MNSASLFSHLWWDPLIKFIIWFTINMREGSIISLYSENTPFGLKGERGRMKGNRIKLTKNRLIFCQIYSTLLLLPPNRRIFPFIGLILPSKSIHLDILDVTWNTCKLKLYLIFFSNFLYILLFFLSLENLY